MPDLESLEKLVKALPEPKSYFRGIQPSQFELPGNIILFQRSHASVFGQEQHYHYRYVLIVNLRTEGTLAIDNRSFDLRPGEALLVFPHQFHHYISQKSESLRWLFVTFELNHGETIAALRNRVNPLSEAGRAYLARLASAYTDNPQRAKGQARHPNPRQGEREKGRMDKGFAGAGAMMAGDGEFPDPGSRKEAGTTASLLTGLLLIELMQGEGRASHRVSSSRPTVIDQINRYIWDNADKDLKLGDLAARFPYSESHLRLLFRKRMGMSLGNYIQKVRMNRARSLLVGSALNVSQVAQGCGYDSLYSFSRAFKKSTGLSPLAYKKLNAGKY